MVEAIQYHLLKGKCIKPQYFVREGKKMYLSDSTCCNYCKHKDTIVYHAEDNLCNGCESFEGYHLNYEEDDRYNEQKEKETNARGNRIQ